MPKHLFTIPNGSALPDPTGLPEGYPFRDDTDGTLYTLKAGTFEAVAGGGGGGGGYADNGVYLEADSLSLTSSGDLTVTWSTIAPVDSGSLPGWWESSVTAPSASISVALPGWYQFNFYFYITVPATSDVLFNLVGLSGTQEWGTEVYAKSTGTSRSTFIHVATPPLHLEGSGYSGFNLRLQKLLGPTTISIGEIDAVILKVA